MSQSVLDAELRGHIQRVIDAGGTELVTVMADRIGIWPLRTTRYTITVSRVDGVNITIGPHRAKKAIASLDNVMRFYQAAARLHCELRKPIHATRVTTDVVLIGRRLDDGTVLTLDDGTDIPHGNLPVIIDGDRGSVTESRRDGDPITAVAYLTAGDAARIMSGAATIDAVVETRFIVSDEGSTVGPWRTPGFKYTDTDT